MPGPLDSYDPCGRSSKASRGFHPSFMSFSYERHVAWLRFPRTHWPDVRGYRIAAAALIAVNTIAACDTESSKAVRDVGLRPSRASAGAPQSISGSADAPLGCISQHQPRVSLRGVLHGEVRPGPPGYGETPTLDRLDTILVMVLPRGISVCRDPAVDPHGLAAIDVEAIQLVGRLAPRTPQAGDTVTVFGGLQQQTWGWHYTTVVLEVDSITRPVRPRAQGG